jgi:hypothetical protein
MKHESVISRIISAIKGNKIAVRENLFYDTLKGNLDFGLDDVPNMRAVLSANSGGVQNPFASVSGITINWQTDLADGVNTYAALLGNIFPRPVVAILSTGTTYVYPGTLPTVDFDGTLINTVTLDWGSVGNGFVRW